MVGGGRLETDNEEVEATQLPGRGSSHALCNALAKLISNSVSDVVRAPPRASQLMHA